MALVVAVSTYESEKRLDSIIKLLERQPLRFTRPRYAGVFALAPVGTLAPRAYPAHSGIRRLDPAINPSKTLGVKSFART